jgi:flagellar biogenesis protein FliO
VSAAALALLLAAGAEDDAAAALKAILADPAVAPETTAAAAPAPATFTAGVAGATGAFGWGTTALALFALGGLGAAAFLRRRRTFAAPEGAIRHIATGHLGPRRSVALLEVLGELLVVGNSEAGLVLLAKLDGPEPRKRLERRAGPAAAPAPTGDAFEALLDRNRAPAAAAREGEELRRKIARWRSA